MTVAARACHGQNRLCGLMVLQWNDRTNPLMQTTNYDPAIIQKFADNLYNEARQITIGGTLVGVITGAVVGFAIGNSIGPGDPAMLPTYQGSGAAAFGVILGLIGFALGRAYGFRLRLQAQLALCQMRIEANTRPPEVPPRLKSNPEDFR